MIGKKSVVVIAVCDQDTSPGVYFKYNGMSNSSSEFFDISFKAYNPINRFKYVRLLYDSVWLRHDVALFRSNLQLSPLLCIIFLVLKLKRVQVICEVPTPYYSHLRTKKTAFSYVLYFIFIPIMFALCDKIIEYGSEGGFLKFFSRKIKIFGNGINVNSLDIKQNSNTIQGRLNIVGAATIASWHGWDYVLHAISRLKRLKSIDVIFHVVGDGPENCNLASLAEQLDIRENVIFHGMQSREMVQSIYNICQLGVGTFRWKQIGIKEASPLKYREYSAVGLPFIYTTFDPDYTDTDVAIMIDEDNVIDDLTEKLLVIIQNNNLPTPITCRKYALEKIDFSRKVNDLFS